MLREVLGVVVAILKEVLIKIELPWRRKTKLWNDKIAHAFVPNLIVLICIF